MTTDGVFRFVFVSSSFFSCYLLRQVAKGQRVAKLDDKQTADMIKITCQRPDVRQGAIHQQFNDIHGGEGGGDRSPDIFSGLLVISSINCTSLFCCFFVLFSITLICHVCWCSYIGVMPCCLLVSSLVLLVFYKIYINSMAVFFSC